MYNPRFTPEEKIQASIEYLLGKKSAFQLVTELKLGKNGKTRILEWSSRYSAYGVEAFDYTGKNAKYSKELKKGLWKNTGPMSILWTKKVERLCHFF